MENKSVCFVDVPMIIDINSHDLSQRINNAISRFNKKNKKVLNDWDIKIIVKKYENKVSSILNLVLVEKQVELTDESIEIFNKLNQLLDYEKDNEYKKYLIAFFLFYRFKDEFNIEINKKIINFLESWEVSLAFDANLVINVDDIWYKDDSVDDDFEELTIEFSDDEADYEDNYEFSDDADEREEDFIDMTWVYTDDEMQDYFEDIPEIQNSKPFFAFINNNIFENEKNDYSEYTWKDYIWEENQNAEIVRQLSVTMDRALLKITDFYYRINNDLTNTWLFFIQLFDILKNTRDDIDEVWVEELKWKIYDFFTWFNSVNWVIDDCVHILNCSDTIEEIKEHFITELTFFRVFYKIFNDLDNIDFVPDNIEEYIVNIEDKNLEKMELMLDELNQKTNKKYSEEYLMAYLTDKYFRILWAY